MTDVLIVKGITKRYRSAVDAVSDLIFALPKGVFAVSLDPMVQENNDDAHCST